MMEEQNVGRAGAGAGTGADREGPGATEKLQSGAQHSRPD